MFERDLVSVVIPTHRRPQWVGCAVESTLRQSYARLEVIVVVDGPDAEAATALRAINDERLRVIELDEAVGGAEARNVGVRAAHGEWVAFLDDDDEWLAEKVEKQMAAAAHVALRYPIVSSRLVAQASEDRVLPRRLYTSGKSVAEYLFCRRGFSYGDGMLQTSTLLTKRGLLLEVPFLKGLKRHQDWDWLLKVAWRPDVEIVMAPEALTCMRVAGDGVSQTGDWELSLAWAKAVRPLMSARAYSFFIATECVPRARKCGARLSSYMRLLWECLWRGQPGLRQIALFLFFCIVPRGVGKKLRCGSAEVVSMEQRRAYNRI